MNTHEGVTISITVPASTAPERKRQIRAAFADKSPGATLDLSGGISGQFTVDEIVFATHHPFAGDGNVSSSELTRAEETLLSCIGNSN